MRFFTQKTQYDYLIQQTSMISIIAAIAQNNCIGKDGTLPWHLPEDLKHFREVTRGKPVIMGRTTWESLPDQFRPLPGRTNIVITRQTDYGVPEGVLAHQTLEAALAHQSDAPEIMIIGGAQIYALALPLADRLYITHVHTSVDGDTFFPDIDPTVWQEIDRVDHTNLSFVTYERTYP